ncbi:MAG: YggS family pyridoxal phosphate-dependent enzyme [Treponema sp.]|nr:YggS family pyridoxal phosphate-dependent enzyme [Treponema sp.]
MADSIAARIERVQERIHTACARCGRTREEVSLMAVTKFQSPQDVQAAWDAGIRLFGESRVQEAEAKFSADGSVSGIRAGSELHLIGSLQRNKAKAAAALFDCVQSVDRESLIDTLGNSTIAWERPLMLLLEYRTGEETKAGFQSHDSLFRAAERAMAFPGLALAGLMTMAPFTDDTAAVRAAFRDLAAARDGLARRFPVAGGWRCLSMGMSGDFEIAIEEGSTMVRIGTALFGERGA